MHRIRLALACAAVTLITAPTLNAQLAPEDRSRLIAEIEAASEHLDPARLPDLDVAKRRVLEAIKNVRAFFDRATTAENRDAWLLYLNLDPLESAIQQDSPMSELVSQAMALRSRTIGTAEGLELSVVVALRQAVDELINAIRFRDSERAIASIKERLATLAERIEGMDENPTPDQFAAVSTLTSLIAGSGQAPTVVRSLQNTFNRPNIAIQIGQTLIQSSIDRDVHELRPVRDCILGTRLVGDAVLDGNISTHLLPSNGTAKINVALTAHISTNNRGFNRGVQLRTLGWGNVHLSRTVSVNQDGIQLGPVQDHLIELQTKITSIQHRLGLVRKIASKKAAKQKPTADRIARGHLKQRVNRQFATETETAREVSPAEWFDRLDPVLKRLSLPAPSQYWSSTHDALIIDSTLRADDQLSAIVSRPAVEADFESAIQIHESAIDNGMTLVLAGRTMDEQKLNELLEFADRDDATSNGDENRDDEADEADDSPFEIDFARVRPVIFEARDNRVRLGVRGTRFSQGGRELTHNMEITATYQPHANEDGSMVLQRDGDVDVDFPGRTRLRVSEVGLRRTIQKKFSRIFPNVILDRPIQAKPDAKIEALRNRTFHPHWISAQDGWLTVTLK